MTRSNLYITLSNGSNIVAVADSSSAPEQGYIVEELIFPLLSCNDTEKEIAVLTEHCLINELRLNATYRYHINLQTQSVRFFNEIYNYQTDAFRTGEDLTRRYDEYVNPITAKP